MLMFLPASVETNVTLETILPERLMLPAKVDAPDTFT